MRVRWFFRCTTSCSGLVVSAAALLCVLPAGCRESGEGAPADTIKSSTPTGDEAPAIVLDLTVDEIFDRVDAAYRECRTYRDSGTVIKTSAEQDGGERVSEAPFSTAFIRPDQFRFAFTETFARGRPNQRIIWRDGADVKIWSGISGKSQSKESLEGPLRAARLSSSGLSEAIPPLLFPDAVRGDAHRLTELPNAKRIDDAVCGTHDCMRIQGKPPLTDSKTIWIDKRTFLVCRIETETSVGIGKTRVVITFNPTINEKISDDLLELDP